MKFEKVDQIVLNLLLIGLSVLCYIDRAKLGAFWIALEIYIVLVIILNIVAVITIQRNVRDESIYSNDHELDSYS